MEGWSDNDFFRILVQISCPPAERAVCTYHMLAHRHQIKVFQARGAPVAGDEVKMGVCRELESSEKNQTERRTR